MKKIIGVIFFFVLAFLVTSSSHAQSPTPTLTAPLDLNTSSNVPQNFHTYSQVVFIELMSAVSCQLSGINPLNPEGKCLGINSTDGKIGFVEGGGALGFINRGIAATYDIPVSGGQYIAHVASNFGITETANAQFGTGSGFRGLSPFLGIWSAFRNITYLFFVLIFILIGLAIMFRVKIDPRSVMTIQNAIPKIIVALVLITLSYAIVGFMVDLMRVSTYFAYGVMSGIPNTDVSGLTPADIQGANPFTAANQLADSKAGISAIATTVTGVVVGTIKDAIGLGPDGGPGLDGLPVIGGIGSIFKSIVNNIPGMGLITSFLSKIPFVGGFVDLLGKVGGGTIDSFTNNSFATYLVHALSLGAGLFVGFQAAQIEPPQGTVGGGGSILGFGVSGTVGYGPGFFISLPMAAVVGTAVTAFTEVLLRELLPNLIAFFIILIALFTAMIRLWFQLVKSYIFLFLYLVLAPFFIAFGVIPGIESGPGSWIRNVVANLAVFPATYIMLLLGKVLVDSVGKSNGDVFVPPLIGDFSNSMAGFAAILGLGILLLTPEVVNMVRGALKAGDSKFGAAIGKSIGIGTAIANKPLSTVRHDLFGKDMMGAPKKGTEWASKKFGPIGRIFSGGGVVPHGKSENPLGSLPLKTRTFGRFTPGGRAKIAKAKDNQNRLMTARRQHERIKESHDYKMNPNNYTTEVGPDLNEYLRRNDSPSYFSAGASTPAGSEERPATTTTTPPADETSRTGGEEAGVPPAITPELLSEAARGGAIEGARGAILAEAMRLARNDRVSDTELSNPTTMQPYIIRAHANLTRPHDDSESEDEVTTS